MLVVDRVELAVIDQITHIGVLDRDQPSRCKQGFHPRCEPVEVWHMSEHIVSDDDIGLLTVGHQLVGELLAEEPTD